MGSAPSLVRRRTTLEHGYAERFGVPDDELAPLVAGFARREELIATSDVLVLPKPQLDDVRAVKRGAVL